jgi:hypothetical protein
VPAEKEKYAYPSVHVAGEGKGNWPPVTVTPLYSMVRPSQLEHCQPLTGGVVVRKQAGPVVLRTTLVLNWKSVAGEHGAVLPASTVTEPPAPLEELEEEDDAALLLLDAAALLLDDAATTPPPAPPTPTELDELTPGVPPKPVVPEVPPKPLELETPPPTPGVPPVPPFPPPIGWIEFAHAANHVPPRQTSAPIPKAPKRLTRMRSPFFSAQVGSSAHVSHLAWRRRESTTACRLTP